jgi:hypothetical protein
MSVSCLFKQLRILPVLCQYTLSLMNLIINNQEIDQTNSSTYSISTRNNHHLHRPHTNLSSFKKSTFYAGINIFNNLMPSVTIFKNNKAKFKAATIQYLHTHRFNFVDEFFMCKDYL